MDAFAYQEPEEEEDDDDQPEGFAVLFDENGAPVIRELDNVTPPNIKTIYAMLWSIIGQITASSLPDPNDK